MKAFCSLFILLITTAAVYACPLCHSATAKKVRASLLGPDLPYNLIVMVIPFAIFAIIILLIYNGVRLPFHSKDKQAL